MRGAPGDSPKGVAKFVRFTAKRVVPILLPPGALRALYKTALPNAALPKKQPAWSDNLAPLHAIFNPSPFARLPHARTCARCAPVGSGWPRPCRDTAEGYQVLAIHRPAVSLPCHNLGLTAANPAERIRSRPHAFTRWDRDYPGGHTSDPSPRFDASFEQTSAKPPFWEPFLPSVNILRAPIKIV